ncbi:prolyl-tRNA synthetase, cytoplasmic [Scheffersomyces amazonensis]|uniref:prolyl-tRNA synthetase, cytoplasmic n=1 Tax=Scheffersomyces amazonensis TaxID=1078765 RepID=UPI00315CD279
MRIFRRFIHIKKIPSLYWGNNERTKGFGTKELLAKLNLIYYPHSGLVHWLPLGLQMRNKIETIIRKHMDEIGFEEIELSSLTDTALWKVSGRLDTNKELFSVDSKFLLSPTSEEEITALVKKTTSSYKQFPLLFYQIGNKYRNEKRPRGGLLRGKEFLMKDGYSFDLSEEAAMNTYHSVFGAYEKIFDDLRLPYVKAEADSGDIGGTLSHEWHYLDVTGEDTIFECNHCHSTSNIEKTLSYAKPINQFHPVDVKYFRTTDHSTLVCAYYPRGRVLDTNFIKNEVDIDLDSDISEEELLEDFSDQETLPSKKFLRIMDSRLSSRSELPEFPILFLSRASFTTLTDIPIVQAIDGEICTSCNKGELKASKSIEVGHTFYLGDKYSRPFECSVIMPETGRQDLIMGCYGIGVSRIIGAIGEVNRDEKGLRWPAIIAPWHVTTIEAVDGDYNELYEQLNENDIDYKLDHSDNNLGKKCAQSNLLGIPLVLIVGRDFPIVKIEPRGKRFTDDLDWKKLYESKHEEFQWTVNCDREGNDVSHSVHKDGAIAVIKSLLKDM